MKFNWIDVFFVILLVRRGYVGFKNGILPEFFRLLGLFIAFILSVNSFTFVSNFLSSRIKWAGTKLDVISFLLIFFLVIFTFKILALITRFLLGRNVSIVNRCIGLVLGLGRGVLLISLIYVLFVNSPFKYLTTSTAERSFSSRYISGVAVKVYKIGSNIYPWKQVATPLSNIFLEQEV